MVVIHGPRIYSVIPSPEGRKNMMKLSQRMIKLFCANFSSSNNQSWTALSESSDDAIRVTTRKNTEPGQPSGVILSAISTTWLPFSHHQVFDLLTDEQRRSQVCLVVSMLPFWCKSYCCWWSFLMYAFQCCSLTFFPMGIHWTRWLT